MNNVKSKLLLYFTLLSTTVIITGLITPKLVIAQLGEEGCGEEEINTAIGCVPVGGTQGFVGHILPWAIGIAGGVALILIVAAGIMITASSGDPKRMQAGKELLTAAVGGLVLLIFGVFILEFIGVSVLNIPDFGQ